LEAAGRRTRRGERREILKSSCSVRKKPSGVKKSNGRQDERKEVTSNLTRGNAGGL